MAMNAAAMWINSAFAGFDEAVTLLIHNLYLLAGGFFTPFFKFISFLGHDGIPIVIVSVLLTIFCATRRCGTSMCFSVAIGALITNCVLKVVIARARPYADENSLYYSLWQLVGMCTEGDKSFPSGHVTAAMASMMAVFLTCRKKVSWTAFIFVFFMCIARVYLVVHFPSDVIAGLIVGFIAGVTGTWLAAKLPSGYFRSPWPFRSKKGGHEKACSD